MTARVGPPPGWAAEAYGAQLTLQGWRAWAVHRREVWWCGLVFDSQDAAIEAAAAIHNGLQSGAA